MTGNWNGAAANATRNTIVGWHQNENGYGSVSQFMRRPRSSAVWLSQALRRERDTVHRQTGSRASVGRQTICSLISCCWWMMWRWHRSRCLINDSIVHHHCCPSRPFSLCWVQWGSCAWPVPSFPFRIDWKRLEFERQKTILYPVHQLLSSPWPTSTWRGAVGKQPAMADVDWRVVTVDKIIAGKTIKTPSKLLEILSAP